MCSEVELTVVHLTIRQHW